MPRFVSHSPSTPGEILDSEFLQPLGITQKTLADHIRVDIKTINRLINGRTKLTSEMAVLLGGAFETTPEFWLNLQIACDLHEIRLLGNCSTTPIVRSA